jgi:predicted nucleic acid-binding protein
MTASTREFVDTNILVYAHDASGGTKREVAANLLTRLWESGYGCLSIQVLQEFFVTVTLKVPHPLRPHEARAVVESFSRWAIHAPGPTDVLAAIDLQQAHRTGFWDAMVLNSAAEMGCHTLWSEDLQSGRVYDGVRVQNPFDKPG